MANVREVVQVAGFSIYQGNADDFALTLTTNGAAQDLTGATITMYLRPPANTTPVAFVLTIVSAVAGTCKKTWTAVETNALEVGAHSAVVRVAFGDGTIATWPTHGSLSVQVLRSGDLV